MRARTFLSALVVLCLLAIPAAADWVDADGHKMHFPQHPDPFGWDVNATQTMLGDDWMCTETGPVSDIHFWGSWRDNLVGPLSGFYLMIWSDIPANPPDWPHSTPGQLIWEYFVPIDQVIVQPMPASPQGWYSPTEGIAMPENHVEWFQYNVFLPEQNWFMQEEGTIYWLAIRPELPSSEFAWGWKTTIDPWNDDACWFFDLSFEWIDMYLPMGFTESLNLAFVITGHPIEPTGACCYDPTGVGLASCIQTTAADCISQYGGSYQGDGTVCGGTEACCLPDGYCLNADALCCVNALGGTPQGAGTTCQTAQACCLPDGTCADLDPLCCIDQGGTPQGAGTTCSAAEACCLPDGTCADLDPLCCIDQGGTPQGAGTLCSAPQACCLNDGTGSCVMVDPLCCDDMGGNVSTVSTVCLGDIDGDGIDDACYQKPWEPGDPHKMHFPQLPDPLGWDVNATHPFLLADDWRCSASGPVTDFHFWGSWNNDAVGNLGAFLIRIYSDIPADPPQNPYSMPGDLLWEFIMPYPEVLTVEMDPSPQGWYDPPTAQFFPDNHLRYFEYNVFLPDGLEPFVQTQGAIYWLCISAFIDDPAAHQWGWKTSTEQYNDDAVRGVDDPPFFWTDMYLSAGFRALTRSGFRHYGRKHVRLYSR